MKRKVLSVVLAGVLALSMTGCGSGSQETTAADKAAETTEIGRAHV